MTARRDPASVTGRPGPGGTLTLPLLPAGLALPDLAGALCKGADPGVWFPSAPGRKAALATEAAKAACTGCPVHAECLEWALDAGEADGVWGGTTPEERAVIRRERLLAARRAGSAA